MIDWWITVKKTITAFFAAGGATFIATFLQQFPQEYIIWGTLSVGGIAAAWRFVTNAYKHRKDE